MMAFKSPTYKDKNIKQIIKHIKMKKNIWALEHKCLILDNIRLGETAVIQL